MYSGYSGHVYSGHSDKVATFPGAKYIHSIIFRSDIVANQILWPERCGPISEVHCITKFCCIFISKEFHCLYSITHI